MQKKHIHIIGIAGTFMAGIAALAHEMGWRVTGCDRAIYPPMSTQLAALGIDVYEGMDAAQLAQYPADQYIIGNIARRGMPVIEEILNRHLPYLSGPEWLQRYVLAGAHPVLAVAGTHGKTTTASMLAWILEATGRQPGFLIGGVAQNFQCSARLPNQQRPIFVIEADEYDTAFFDKRSKFVHYHPDILIINNLEFDHADIFADLAAIQTQFHHLIRTVPSAGQIFYPTAQPTIEAVLQQGVWSRTTALGVPQGWHGQSDGKTGFEVFFGTQKIGVATGIFGAHNRANALAAIAAAVAVGIDAKEAVAALSRFLSVKRRMEVIGEIHGVTVIDDFAHHPGAISATLAAVAEHYPQRRILAVLEPRSNTMKLGVMKDALDAALQLAHQVYCYRSGVTWDVAAAIPRAEVFDQIETLVAKLVAYSQQGDVILLMSNGAFGGIYSQLLQALEDKKHG